MNTRIWDWGLNQALLDITPGRWDKIRYIMLFLEGIVTFISPCLLPMIPLYVSYFVAGEPKGTGKSRALINSVGFVIGFTLVFLTLGVLASSVGMFLSEYSTIVNIVAGFIVVVLGLNFCGLLHIGFLSRTFHVADVSKKNLGFFSSILFGIVFSIGWTPCVGAFLGSALMLASAEGSVVQGTLMLLMFSLGLGLPFIVCAVLIDQLKDAFDFIKRNYKVINIISGGLLIALGILMMTGYMGYFLSLLTF